jgi:hypothetical protein
VALYDDAAGDRVQRAADDADLRHEHGVCSMHTLVMRRYRRTQALSFNHASVYVSPQAGPWWRPARSARTLSWHQVVGPALRIAQRESRTFPKGNSSPGPLLYLSNP